MHAEGQESCTLGNPLTEGALLQAVLEKGIGFVSADPSRDLGVVFCLHRWLTDEERRRHHNILWGARFVSVSLSWEVIIFFCSG